MGIYLLQLRSELKHPVDRIISYRYSDNNLLLMGDTDKITYNFPFFHLKIRSFSVLHIPNRMLVCTQV